MAIFERGTWLRYGETVALRENLAFKESVWESAGDDSETNDGRHERGHGDVPYTPTQIK